MVVSPMRDQVIDHPADMVMWCTMGSGAEPWRHLLSMAHAAVHIVPRSILFYYSIANQDKSNNHGENG